MRKIESTTPGASSSFVHTRSVIVVPTTLTNSPPAFIASTRSMRSAALIAAAASGINGCTIAV
jgi:hypothetical protein